MGRKGFSEAMNSRRSTRIAVQPTRTAKAAPEPDDDESMDMDVESAPSQTSRRKMHDSEEEYDSGTDTRKRGGGGGRGRRKSGDGPGTKDGEGKKQRKKQAMSDMGVVLPHEEMVHNCLLYLLLVQHKKIPAKKSDIIKHAMNGQAREFEEVFKDLEGILNQIFGIKVVGIGETQKSGFYSNYIIVSNYNLSVCDMVTPRDHDVDCRRSILFLILTVIFMLNRSIDEDLIWKIMNDTKLNTLVCEKRDNLRRFLKQEYVATMYLNLEENSDNDPPIIRYSWGFRADKEFSKYSILKFVTKQFPGKKPIDFTIQYGIAKETEGELVAADAAIEEREAEENAENIPPIEGSLLEEDEEELLSQPYNRHGEDENDTMETDELDSGSAQEEDDDDDK